MEFELIVQTGAIIGILLGFTEWRYKSLHGCMTRIESRLDTHLDK